MRRQADQWEPLVAIADAAGGDWPAVARRACVELVTAARGSDEQSLGIRLLSDIHDVFADRDRLDTATIVAGLCDIDDAPWADWLDGKSDKARGGWLAKKLKPYGVRPADHRFDAGIRKGYLADDFANLWRRYLPPPTERNKRNKGNAPGRDVAFVASVAFDQQDEEELFPMNTERKVRAMSKAERRAYLAAHGWRRLGSTWLHPSFDEPGGDRGFYSLAAAIRTALAEVPS